MRPIAFTLIGVPQPKGSAQGFVLFPRDQHGRLFWTPKGVPRTKVVITSDNPKVKRWQKEVARAAKLALGGVDLELTGAVRVEATFYLPAPAKLPKDRAGLPIVRPDLDKCLRAILDALTGTFYQDDEQVVDLVAHKRYSDTPASARVEVTVTPIETRLPLFERSSHGRLRDYPDISTRVFGARHP
jgi:Holliday junction resolvase RusA-like endonuclease